jgi:hypothetical protein
VIEHILIELLLWLCALAAGWTLGRRSAYHHAARSVWPATTELDRRITLPAAELPAASRRALHRRQRANRADLARVLRRSGR